MAKVWFVCVISLALLAFAKAEPILVSREGSGNQNWVRQDDGEFLIGIGIADVTGPCAEVGMMGYANPGQSARGIHFRQYARTFIACEAVDDCLVFVSGDIGMMSSAVTNTVHNRLAEKFGTKYTRQNVLLSGTHTHSGPAGYLQYFLFQITNLGYIDDTTAAIVDGIVESIEMADANLKPGRILYGETEVMEANINRSPSAYLNNPEEERNQYAYDVDKTMWLLRFDDLEGNPLGSFNWFPVHPTSMNNTNTLVSGDNKGVASMLFEAAMNPGSMPGKGPFVAAFAASNLGDVSPNIRGPHCQDTGLPCDQLTSTCGGFVQLCIATGPGKDMIESTRIIGERQFTAAYNLFNDVASLEPITGTIRSVHQFTNMSNYEFEITDAEGNPQMVHTCPPAMGFSFAAGTTDGPGAFDFTQGTTTNNSNPLWEIVGGILHDPTEEQEACHFPKPILLDTGYMTFPYKWQPDVVDTVVAFLGNLAIIGVPGELTTMSGRRMRNTIRDVMSENGVQNPKTVIAGLTNVYSDYVTTFEEYQIQRYEGASTIFGPHTLGAYLDQYSKLAKALLTGEELELGPLPPDLLDDQISFVIDPLYDGALFNDFGDCVQNPYPSYAAGETVTVKFVSGHPRNKVKRGDTYLTVERKVGEEWQVVFTDAHWETQFIWTRTNTLTGESEVTVTWEIPLNTSGEYRIRHFGDHKVIFTGDIVPYTGTCGPFQVHATKGSPAESPIGDIYDKSSLVAKLWNLLRNVG